MKKRYSEAERRAYKLGKIRGWYASQKNKKKKGNVGSKPRYGDFDASEALARNLVRNGMNNSLSEARKAVADSHSKNDFNVKSALDRAIAKSYTMFDEE